IASQTMEVSVELFLFHQGICLLPHFGLTQMPGSLRQRMDITYLPSFTYWRTTRCHLLIIAGSSDMSSLEDPLIGLLVLLMKPLPCIIGNNGMELIVPSASCLQKMLSQQPIEGSLDLPSLCLALHVDLCQCECCV